MKDMGEADVILGIKIKRENKGIVITQSHYIEKILRKFNREDCSPVSTPMDPVENLKPNIGKPVDQLEYSRAIGCLMYAMTSTRPDIAYAVGRLSRFTSNPSRQHWQAITRVFKYLKGTMNYGLSYMGYPLVLEGYSDASWINHVEDSSSTSGWVFCLGEVPFHGLPRSKQHQWFYYGIEFVALGSFAWLGAYSQIYIGKSRHLDTQFPSNATLEAEFNVDYTRRRRAVSTGSGGISTAGASMPVSTAGMVQEVNISIPSLVVVKDKAVRLQEELDKEERQRMARVYKAAQSFTKEEWENIRARVEADEELSKRLQAEERNKYNKSLKQRKEHALTQTQQRNYMINYIKHMGSHVLQQLKRYSFDELNELFETTMKNVNTFVPIETEDKGRASELATGSSQATIIDSAEVGSSKRAAEAELDHEGSKRKKTNEASGSVQEQPEEEEKELS
ncbi:zinc finger, CCHC-type containing protein [Tanacetum coccineum]